MGENNNTLKQLLIKVGAGVLLVLLVGTWSLMYYQLQRLQNIVDGRGERIRALELWAERVDRLEIKIDKLEDLVRDHIATMRKP